MKFITAGGIRSSSPSEGIGYNPGAGGTVVQLTNKSTGVTLNKACGKITLHNASLAAGATVSFLFTNSVLQTLGQDLILMNILDGTPGGYVVNALPNGLGGGSAWIDVKNISAGALAEAISIQFAIFRIWSS